MSNILIFNMRMDSDDGVLGFATDWVNEIAQYFDKVFVITHFSGTIKVSANVSVFSIGQEKGFSRPKRLLEFYRITKQILRSNKIDFCFVHMIQLFAILAAPLMKINKIPVTMWYAHQSVPFSLKIAHYLVDQIVTSSPSAYRLTGKKVAFIGQGITEHKFRLRPFKKPATPFIITYVARLAESKHQLELIDAIGEFILKHGKDSIKLFLIGEVLKEGDLGYKDLLKSAVKKHSLEDCVVFCGSIPHDQVSKFLLKSDLSVNLAPAEGSIDKSALESMAMGLPVLAQNRSLCKVFFEAGVDPEPYSLPDCNPLTILKYLEKHTIFWSESNWAQLKKISAHVHLSHGLKGLAERAVREIYSLKN